MFPISMPVVTGSIVVMISFVALTVAPFTVFRRFYPLELSDDLKSAGNWGAVRIGTIHALILALVFAEVRQEYNDLRETIENEALALEQL